MRTNNPQYWIYAPTSHNGYRGLHARERRETSATLAGEKRQEKRFWRDNGNAGTVKCVVAWINATFGASLQDLPQGEANDASHCPIANALWGLNKFGEVEVDGPSISVEYDINDESISYDDVRDEWVSDTGVVQWHVRHETPICVRVFVREFDNGNLPEYAHSQHSDYEDDYEEYSDY